MSSKGGSIRGFAQLSSTGKRPRSERFLQMLSEEERRGVTKPAIYLDWFEAIENRKRAVLAYVDAAIAAGKTVAGYGASTTTTTLLYHFELEKRTRLYRSTTIPWNRDMFQPRGPYPGASAVGIQ